MKNLNFSIKLIIIAFISLSNVCECNRPRVYDLIKILDSASFIGKVDVIKYKECKGREYIVYKDTGGKRLKSKVTFSSYPGGSSEKPILTGTRPDVNKDVFLVVDKENEVVLLAIIEANDLLFYTPNKLGWVAFFQTEEGIRPYIEDAEENSVHDDRMLAVVGCYYNKGSFIKKYGDCGLIE